MIINIYMIVGKILLDEASQSQNVMVVKLLTERYNNMR